MEHNKTSPLAPPCYISSCCGGLTDLRERRSATGLLCSKGTGTGTGAPEME